jgi:membrane protease YdiL (CAAX protease family)
MDSRDITDTDEIPVVAGITKMSLVLDTGDNNLSSPTVETIADTMADSESTTVSASDPVPSSVSRRTRFSVTLLGLVLPAGVMIVASLVFMFLAGHVLPASLVVPSSVLLMVLFEVLGALFAYWLIPDKQKERWLDGASTGDSRSGSSHLSRLLSSPVSRFLKIDGFRRQDLMVGMRLGAAMWLGLQVIKVLAVFSGVHVDPSTTTSTLASTSGLWYVFIFLFCVPVLVPFVEELLFRGALSSVFESVLSPRAASILFVIVSTFWFGLAHFQGAASITDLLVVAWTATIGLINCLLVLRQKTIWGAFGLHMAHNGITVLLMVIASLFV